MKPYLVIKEFIPTTSGSGTVVLDIMAFDDNGVEIPDTHRNLPVSAEMLADVLNRLPNEATMDDAYDMVGQTIAQLAPDLSLASLTSRVEANLASAQTKASIEALLAEYALVGEVRIPAK